MSKTGFWGWDASGLPTYTYTGGYPAKALDRTGHDSQLPDDPCFLLGNYRMTLFTHVSGRYELISGERGWARLNHCGRNLGFNQAMIRIAGADTPDDVTEYELVGVPSEHSYLTEETFGVGFARYHYACPMGLQVTRVLSVQPSVNLHQGNASFLLTVIVENVSEEALKVQYRETVLANYRMMSTQEEGPDSPCQRVQYENSVNVDEERCLVTADISCRPVKLLVLPDNPQQSFQFDCYPPTLFLRALGTNAWDTQAGAGKDQVGDMLWGEAAATLAPGERKTVHMVAGFCFSEDKDSILQQIQDMVDKAQDNVSGDIPGNAIGNVSGGISGSAISNVLENISGNALIPEGIYTSYWKQVLPGFDEETDEVLRMEMLWNAYTLEAMATYNQYFQEIYIPQGSVYAYHLGQNASNRDHLQHLLPMIYINPALAKSCIRFAMKHSLENGEIKRQDIGYGYCDPGIYMESDAQIYMLMAVGEYLRLTSDYGLLDEEVSYYPAEHGKKDTVFHVLLRHFIYLRDTVGTGRHGLVKMLNSDWSDSFFHPYSPNIYAQVAESHMNTAMVLAVLPSLIVGLKQYAYQASERRLVSEFIDALQLYRDTVYKAFMTDMEGRIFSPRCYIGFDEDPKFKFGMDTLCLEPQIFLLQMEDFPLERKKALWKTIFEKNLCMEKSGARTREIPLWDEGGHGEDGGIWFSHQGGLIVGLSTFDREAARELFHKLTFHHYAEEYPDFWLGHWTFADSLESTLSDREGLYHFWTPGAFHPFCAHAHAWMLYCYYKLKEHDDI